MLLLAGSIFQIIINFKGKQRSVMDIFKTKQDSGEVKDVLINWHLEQERRETRLTLVSERDKRQDKLHSFGRAVLFAFPDRVDDARASKPIRIESKEYNGVPISRVLKISTRTSRASTVPSSPTYSDIVISLYEAVIISSEKIDDDLVLPGCSERLGAPISVVDLSKPHDEYIGIYRDSETWDGVLDSNNNPLHRDNITRQILDEYFQERESTAEQISKALSAQALNPLPIGVPEGIEIPSFI